MLPKDYEQSKIFFKTEDGEMKQFTEIKGIENIGNFSDEQIEISEFTEYEDTLKLSRKTSKKLKKMFLATRPKLFTNNWRKMHHLPMIRRRGKRE